MVMFGVLLVAALVWLLLAVDVLQFGFSLAVLLIGRGLWESRAAVPVRSALAWRVLQKGIAWYQTGAGVRRLAGSVLLDVGNMLSPWLEAEESEGALVEKLAADIRAAEEWLSLLDDYGSDLVQEGRGQ